MQKVSANSSNPFVKDGKPNVDAYIEFVNQFNEFVNHTLKPFKPLIEKDMKLQALISLELFFKTRNS